jgi:hypothetical protein
MESEAWCATRLSFGATFIFAICIRDLTEKVPEEKLVLFPHDTNLLITWKYKSDLQHKI